MRLTVAPTSYCQPHCDKSEVTHAADVSQFTSLREVFGLSNRLTAVLRLFGIKTLRGMEAHAQWYNDSLRTYSETVSLEKLMN